MVEGHKLLNILLPLVTECNSLCLQTFNEQILRAVGRLGDRARRPFLLEPSLLGKILERQQRGLLPARGDGRL